MRRWFLVAILLCVWEVESVKKEISFEDVKSNAQEIPRSVAKLLFQLARRTASEVNISIGCQLSFLRLINGLLKVEDWALKMIDATAKPPSGILQGSVSSLGDYDECLDVTLRNPRGKVDFIGQYCLINMLPSEKFREHYMPFMQKFFPVMSSYNNTQELFRGLKMIKFSLNLGLCVPSSCTTEDINETVSFATSAIGMDANVRCETKSKGLNPNREQIVILCLFAFLSFLVIIGTALDIMDKNCKKEIKSGCLKKFLTSFSFHSNSLRLFKTTEEGRCFSAVRGIRVLSMSWIILSHIYYFPYLTFFAKFDKWSTYLERAQEFLYRPIPNGLFAVETFFVMSGMLLVHDYWKGSRMGRRISFIAVLVIRGILRMLCVQAFAIGLLMILPLLGDGPLWNATFEGGYAACTNNWWWNVLFIQNFHFTEACLPHSWFLAALAQLFIMLSFVVPLLFRYPKIGIAINVILIVIGSSVTGLLTSIFDLYSQIKVDGYWSKIFQTVSFAFHRPYTEMCSFCIGILLGYVVVTQKSPKITLRTQLVCWLMSISGIVAVIYGGYFFDDKGGFAIANATLQRVVWGISVCWIIFASMRGYGGIIGRLLSWKGMIFFDRISFLMYLIHPSILMLYTAGLRSTIPFSHLQQVCTFLLVILITTVVSYVANVSFQQPLYYVENVFCNATSRKPLPAVTEAETKDTCMKNTVPSNEMIIGPTNVILTNVSKI